MIYQLVAHVQNFVLRVPGHASASDALIAVFVRHADAAGLEISAGITRNGGQRDKKEEAEVDNGSSHSGRSFSDHLSLKWGL